MKENMSFQEEKKIDLWLVSIQTNALRRSNNKDLHTHALNELTSNIITMERPVSRIQILFDLGKPQKKSVVRPLRP